MAMRWCVWQRVSRRLNEGVVISGRASCREGSRMKSLPSLILTQGWRPINAVTTSLRFENSSLWPKREPHRPQYPAEKLGSASIPEDCARRRPPSSPLRPGLSSGKVPDNSMTILPYPHVFNPADVLSHLGWPFVLLILVVLGLVVLRWWLTQRGADSANVTMQPRPIMTPGELAFFAALEPAVSHL